MLSAPCAHARGMRASATEWALWSCREPSKSLVSSEPLVPRSVPLSPLCTPSLCQALPSFEVAATIVPQGMGATLAQTQQGDITAEDVPVEEVRHPRACTTLTSL